jgi:hypothetical protein
MLSSTLSIIFASLYSPLAARWLDGFMDSFWKPTNKMTVDKIMIK